MKYTAEKVETMQGALKGESPKLEESRYRLRVSKFVTDIEGNQVEVQPIYIHVVRKNLERELDDINARILACDAADKLI